MTNEEKVVFEGGATRGSNPPNYRRVEWDFLRRVAEALTEGAEKYPDHEDGVENWKHGGREFARAAFDHTIEHLYKWKEGDRGEDHVGHAGAGLMFLGWFEHQGIWNPAEEKLWAQAKEEAEEWREYDLFPEETQVGPTNAPENTTIDSLESLARTLTPVEKARLFFGLPLKKESN